MRRLHLLTGEYPPNAGGVGDYTFLLAGALARRGCDVHVWCPEIDERTDLSVRLHRLPDVFGERSMRALERALAEAPGRLLLQYVPNALGRRGANLAFCQWLVRARDEHGADVRVMFHEPYFYFTLSPPRVALAVVQRMMAWVLLRAASRVYVSTETWIRYLRRWAPQETSFLPLAIPATIPAEAAPDDVRRWRATFGVAPRTAHVVGHFGTFGDTMARELRAVVPAVLRANPFTTFACIGRNSTWFAQALVAADDSLRERIVATGSVEPSQVAAALRACDLVLQPYPEGVTTRRTSVMAPLACGVAVVTTDGPLSESTWCQTGAVRLIEPSHARGAAAAVAALLKDEQARDALARRGREIYAERFSLERTIERLLPEVGSIA